MRLDSGRTIIGTTALGERHCAFAFSLLEKEYTHSLLSGDLMIVRRTGSKGRKKYICCAQTKRCPLPHKRHKRPKNYVGVFGFSILSLRLSRQKHAAPAARRRKRFLVLVPFSARCAHVNEQSASARCELTQEESKSFDALLPISGFLYIDHVLLKARHLLFRL